jgi:hypothetical protein
MVAAQRHRTVFLSYRRADFGWAAAIHGALTHRGFDVFIDFEGLGAGRFAEAILENIAARAHFVLVLTPTALDRAGMPDDWLRREIETAILLERNIVPVMVDGFDFGADNVARALTGSLAPLPEFNGLLVVRAYFSEAMVRLVDNFLNPPVAAMLQKPSRTSLEVARRQRAAADTAAPPAPGTGRSKAAPRAARAAEAAGEMPDSLIWPARLAVRRTGTRFDYALSGPAAEDAWAGSQAFQPEIIEQLHSSDLATRSAEDWHALFQTLIPRPLRAALRQTTHLLIDVDPNTGNLPWERLQPEPPRDGVAGIPLGVRAGVVRRLTGLKQAPAQAEPPPDRALVIADPTTAGFSSAFRDQSEFPRLPGAAAEGANVGALLREHGIDVRQTSADADAREVMAKLHAAPLRMLHIAGHGVLAAVHNDGSRRSGIVLSNGALLSASEIAGLDVLPELVVLTCQYFGLLSGTAGEPSFVETLLQAGVRCLVAPAGPVNDDAAKRFSEVFYDHLLRRGEDFGIAVWAARRALWHVSSDDFTFATLHAYGDPAWHVRRD